MSMTGTEMAVLGGAGGGALTFVLGVVQRYVSPRFEAQAERIARLEAEARTADAKAETMMRDIEKSRSRSQEFTSLKIAEVHAKFEALMAKQGEDLSDIKAALAEIKGEMKARRPARGATS